MNDVVFSGQIPGIMAEEVSRTNEFSMPSRHFHDSLELYFLLEGERYYFIEQDTWHVKSQMAVLIDRSQIHKTSTANGCSAHRRFLLQLEPSVLDGIFSLSSWKSLRDWGRCCCGLARFSSGDWERVLTVISSIKQEFLHPSAESRDLCALLSMQLILLFTRCRCQSAASTPKPVSSQAALLSSAAPVVHTGMYQHVHEIALYLQTHCSESCSLDEIAARFFISKPYLTRIFKSVTGFTVTEYLTVCRVRKAQILLEETGLSITEIAAQTGFGNITYFEKVFKKMTGFTPLQYRKGKGAFQSVSHAPSSGGSSSPFVR